MEMSWIKVGIENGIATITLNRPKALNSLSRSMIETMRAEIASFSVNEEVRALVITGTGRAFCAGADLNDPMMGMHLPLEEQSAACSATLDGLMNALIRDISNAPFPTITVVNGIAAGGGVGLSLATDITIAAKSAKFTLAFVPKLGLIPDLGATWHVARQLGRSRALGLVLLGESLTAQQAVDWGLIWQCFDDEQLEEAAGNLAVQLANGPRNAQLKARQLVDSAFINDFSTQLDAERDMQASQVTSSEVAEAMAAFKEKRAPDFTRTR